MIEKEKYPVSNQHPSEYGEKDITQGEQYKIDAVVAKMKKNPEYRDIIYQFSMGIS